MRDHHQWMFLSHDWSVKSVYNRDQPVIVCDMLLDGNEFEQGIITDEHGKMLTKPRTDILYGCACGKVKVITLQGRWTLEQINGESSCKPKSEQR